MNAELARTLRFGLIGIASTGFYFLLLIILRPLIPSTMLLAAICYAIAMAFNFLAQGLFTFQTTKLTGKQLGRYIVVQGTALIVNSVALAGAVDRMGFALIPSQLVITAVVTVCVYVVSKRWVFG